MICDNECNIIEVCVRYAENRALCCQAPSATEPVPEASLNAIISSLPTQPENQLDIGLEILRNAFTQKATNRPARVPFPMATLEHERAPPTLF